MIHLTKSYRLVGALLAKTLLCGSLIASVPISGQSLTKKRVLADIECIHSIFDVKYAPKPWKKEFAGWDLDQSIEEAKNKIESHPTLSLKDSQIILRDFFNSTKDYHVGVRFYSTENATLPFLIKGAEGRYFISFVDTEQLTEREFPFQEGDEILAFDGEPIDNVVKELRLREFGTNTYETDQALAEMSLTQRRGDMGQVVPSGKVEITGLKKGAASPRTISMTWRYTPEKIRDFSKLGFNMGLETLAQESHDPSNLRALLKKSQFFEKFMVASIWDHSYVGCFTQMNKHALGARTTFTPSLGRKVWKSSSDSIFDAYIFETATGKKVGYVRLPHYIGDEEEVEEFGMLMNYFQKRTDALVIDQVNNPGGSIFYLYALVATLTDKPLYTPKHHIALTQEEVYMANVLLPYLEQVTSDETAQMVLGETFGGYPIDYRFVKLMKQFCTFLIGQWNAGKLYSDPTFLFGVDEIQPHPRYRYSKPILLLVNSLDFSGGDFFPAILQDNKRVTVFGTRTAGAGGYVMTNDYPNHSGMKGFVMTGSLAERIDKKPIENLGVRPDIQYDLTAIDLQEEYKQYISAILETVETIAVKS